MLKKKKKVYIKLNIWPNVERSLVKLTEVLVLKNINQSKWPFDALKDIRYYKKKITSEEKNKKT